MCAFPFAAAFVEVPPRQAILRADDAGLIADQWAQAGSDIGEAVCLDGEQNVIDGADAGGIISGVWSGGEFANRTVNAHPIFLHRTQVRTTRNQSDVFARS